MQISTQPCKSGCGQRSQHLTTPWIEPPGRKLISTPKACLFRGATKEKVLTLSEECMKNLDGQNQSITSLLKRHTQSAHERLHRHPKLAKLTRTDLTREDYIWFLSKQFGFYEACFAKNLKNPFNDISSPSQDWLKSDLTQLGVSTESLPLCQDIPKLKSQAHWLGFLYVKEGALLGGQVMFSNIKRNHAGLSSASRYLVGWADRSAERWQNTTNTINTLLANKDLTTAQGTALQTFLCFEKWISD